MVIYTVSESNRGLVFYVSDNGDGASGGSIDISTFTNASADGTDRFVVSSINWCIAPGGDVRFAWDGTGGGAGTPGTVFITLNGNSNGVRAFPSVLDQDTVEGSTTPSAGDLHITDTSGSFYLTIWCEKLEGFGGFPDFAGNQVPFGPTALD